MTTKKKKGGRPPARQLTDKEISQIEMLAGLGIKREDIIHVLGISKHTMNKQLFQRPEVKQAFYSGKAKANVKVAQIAYNMAASGDHPNMTMFWLRTQAGWTEKIDLNIEQTHSIVFRAQVGDDGTIFNEKIEGTTTKANYIDADIVKDLKDIEEKKYEKSKSNK